MIEYYTLMHKGGQEEYRDNIYLNFSKALTMLILYSSKDESFDDVKNKKVNALIGSCSELDIETLIQKLEKEVGSNNQYLLIRIDDSHIYVKRNGSVFAKFVKKGELFNLSNGYHSLEDGDQICCGTNEFFKNLTDTAVLVDAMSSISSEEWMDFMCSRISDVNQFDEENISAVTMIVRED